MEVLATSQRLLSKPQPYWHTKPASPQSPPSLWAASPSTSTPPPPPPPQTYPDGTSGTLMLTVLHLQACPPGQPALGGVRGPIALGHCISDLPKNSRCHRTTLSCWMLPCSCPPWRAPTHPPTPLPRLRRAGGTDRIGYLPPATHQYLHFHQQVLPAYHTPHRDQGHPALVYLYANI